MVLILALLVSFKAHSPSTFIRANETVSGAVFLCMACCCRQRSPPVQISFVPMKRFQLHAFCVWHAAAAKAVRMYSLELCMF